MRVLIQSLAVGAAGFLGALTRWGVAALFGRWINVRFPVGTFVINITGSLFLGWFLTFVGGRYPVSDTMKLAIATGFVGAYTTFSTFMYESSRLVDDGAGLEAIVQKVRELGLAGATVLRGSEGFGAHSVVHKSSLLEMSTDLPIIIEVVDTKDKIQLLLPHLDQLVLEGMVTMEYVAILIYRHGRESEAPPAAAPG